MTTWTTNLEVPHLDQNVAQPEIPENVAKDIFDAIFAGKYTTDLPADADYTYIYVADPKLAQNWHNFVQEFTDTGFPLTATRKITFPINNRPYLLINNTDQTLDFEIVGQSTPISLVNGGANMYCYSDGTDLIKFEFAADPTTLLSLTDTPGTYDNTKILRSTAAGTEWYDIVTDLATKLNHTSGTATTLTLSGTTTNSGTINGGIISDAELVDFSFTRQAVTSGATPDFDLSSGSIVTYTNTETMSPTFTTTQTDTSFKLLITNGEAFVITWPSVSWAGGTKPTLTAAGVDLLEFHKINSVWYGTVIDLNLS